MSALKRIRDFKAPKDEASAAELRRQLGQLESNVSDMGDAMTKVSMGKLTRALAGIVRDDTCVLSPGQFQLFDTSAADVSTTLAKPTAADAGTFLVAINMPGSANDLNLLAAAGCTIDGAASASVVTSGNALVFCDGENYWALF